MFTLMTNGSKECQIRGFVALLAEPFKILNRTLFHKEKVLKMLFDLNVVINSVGEIYF